MNKIYITSSGIFLPNAPVSKHDMEHYLGKINGQKSRVKRHILKQNGIKSRFYAIDKSQKKTHSNAQLAVNAVYKAVEKSELSMEDIQLLCTGTTQGDLPIPGFGSMVHGSLPITKCEVASFQSVCASGMMAIKNAYAQIKANEKQNAICVASELVSRLFKASRFEAQNLDSLPFNAEFLRWMLSDGAGAFVLQNKKNKSGVTLEIDWIDLQSHASVHPVCMYAGKIENRNEYEKSWLDYPSYEQASAAGAINLKQDVKLLDKVVKTGVDHYFELIEKGMIEKDKIDWLCCHYSSEVFRAPIKELMQKGGGEIAESKWFSNLTSKGNTGSASIFIMVEELMYSGMLRDGQQILCMVPESGRFITSFMKLTVVNTP